MAHLDIVLIALVVASLPVCVWKPWIGVLLYCWLAMMVPQRLVGGVASECPLSKLVAAATLIGLLFTRERYALPRRGEIYVLAALWLMFLTSTAFGAIEPERAWRKFTEVSKIFLMTGVTVVLFQDRAKLRALLLVMSLSLGTLGIIGGVWGFETGLQERLFGPTGSWIGDNNALGFAFAMTLPLLAYVRRQERRRALRVLLLLTFGLTIIALFATYSRAAFISLCLVLPLMALHIRTSDKALFAVGLGACVLIHVAPQQWTERMHTITPSVYRVDGSGIQRMKAWYVAWRLGVDHVWLGAGFFPFSPAVYEHYIPGYRDYHDAHNHFLQVFAEHGLPGLVGFVALIGLVLLHLWRLWRHVRSDARHAWIADYAAGIGFAVVVFVVEGVFTNMPYNELYLNLVAATIVLQEIAASANGSACATCEERAVVTVLRRVPIVRTWL